MKLLEKLKNTFFEEEYIEVEEPKVIKQEVAKKVEPKEIKREEVKAVPAIEEKKSKTVVEEEMKIENYSDGELSRKDNKFPYFEDEDFVEMDVNSTKQEETKKIYGGKAEELYSSIHYNDTSTNKPYSAPLKESFKPTPIISPIYGILDKNYHKDEVIDKKDRMQGVSSYVSRKNADLDSIRKKAYGGLEPLEEMNKPVNNMVEEEEDNLLYDMTSDNSKPMVDQVTIADAEEYFEDLGLEYNIDYKDTRYEKATGRRTTYKPEEETKNIDLEESANLEDNLFDLIDSMYEEGEE